MIFHLTILNGRRFFYGFEKLVLNTFNHEINNLHLVESVGELNERKFSDFTFLFEEQFSKKKRQILAQNLRSSCSLAGSSNRLLTCRSMVRTHPRASFLLFILNCNFENSYRILPYFHQIQNYNTVVGHLSICHPILNSIYYIILFENFFCIYTSFNKIFFFPLRLAFESWFSFIFL